MQPQSSSTPSQSRLETVVITQQGLRIAAKGEREVTKAVGLAEKVDATRLSRRAGGARVRAAEVPILSQTALGLAFLDLTGARALAYGDPPQRCPAVGLSAPGASGRAAAVESAFGACFAELERRRDTLPGGDAPCGCRLGALDDVVLLSREQTAYARGTAARLRAPALGLDGLFVADPAPDGGIVLSDASGPFAIVAFEPGGGTAGLVFLDAPGTVFRGRDLAVGFRRGRLARRLYLQDSTGRQVSLLIGFAPAELDAYAAGWLVFPEGAERPVARRGGTASGG
ncbi:MAG: hypothetical protein AAFP17_17435 [Pseudomonadota bacterium]